MMVGVKAHYDGIVAFTQTDFTEDLKKISVPGDPTHKVITSETVRFVVPNTHAFGSGLK
jgi:hypothetical protein